MCDCIGDHKEAGDVGVRHGRRIVAVHGIDPPVEEVLRTVRLALVLLKPRPDLHHTYTCCMRKQRTQLPRARTGTRSITNHKIQMLKSTVALSNASAKLRSSGTYATPPCAQTARDHLNRGTPLPTPQETCSREKCRTHHRKHCMYHVDPLRNRSSYVSYACRHPVDR
jgi:hypothetical protein